MVLRCSSVSHVDAGEKEARRKRGRGGPAFWLFIGLARRQAGGKKGGGKKGATLRSLSLLKGAFEIVGGGKQ